MTRRRRKLERAAKFTYLINFCRRVANNTLRCASKSITARDLAVAKEWRLKAKQMIKDRAALKK